MNLRYLKAESKSPFVRISLALSRRVMPSLVANKLAGTQPMSVPVRLAFAMRTIYNNE